jgi:hypothetical protein
MQDEAIFEDVQIEAANAGSQFSRLLGQNYTGGRTFTPA